MSKVWQLLPGGLCLVESTAALEQLLCRQNGIKDELTEHFFSPRYDEHVHDPELLSGVTAAVAEIYDTIAKNGRILVYGDYDVDGISATAIAVSALQDAGANVVPYLPHRVEDGYGISRKILESAIEEFDLLISVDCGIGNKEEIDWLVARGKKAIIVDHHALPATLPPAIIVHPAHPAGSYPWPELCGAAVTWKLAQALLRDERSPHANNPDREKWLLDLALLGTVGDVMPLQGENRLIARFGLEVLRRTKRPGLRALMDLARLSAGTINIEDVSYRLVPLLNAAGRMDHPQLALDLLLAKSAARAGTFAQRLLSLNKARQILTRRIVQEAEAQVDVSASIVFASNLAWPAGVVGLVAGQLARKFARPAVVVGGNGKHAVGSARSVAGLNILAGLKFGREYMLRFGGHAQAAGFSIEETKLSPFRKALETYYQKINQRGPDASAKQANAVLSETLLNWDTVRLIEKFEPFGHGNPKPGFVIKHLPVLESRLVGKSQQHVKFTFAAGSGELDGIGFGLAKEAAKVKREADVLGSLDLDHFRGRPKLQLRIADVAQAGSVTISERK